MRRFKVNDPLIVLEDGVFLVGVVVRLKGDFQSMSRLRWRLQVLFLSLMDPLEEIELCIPLLGLVA